MYVKVAKLIQNINLNSLIFITEVQGRTEEVIIGGPKLIVWPTQKIDPGQLVIIILSEPFHH